MKKIFIILISCMFLSNCSKLNIFGFGKSKNEFEKYRVNEPLWKSSLSFLSKYPNVESDLQEGLISTDWIVSAKNPDTRFRIAVYILGSNITHKNIKVITDKEISSRVTELEGKFQKNTLNIENKRNELSILNNQLNPINTELESLNEKKSLLTSQYNLEISKKFYNKDQKSIELSEKLKNELENVTSEVLKAEQQSALLKTEISSLNKSLNEQILQSNKIREDINNINSNKYTCVNV